jgi:hypothetical protein
VRTTSYCHDEACVRTLCQICAEGYQQSQTCFEMLCVLYLQDESSVPGPQFSIFVCDSPSPILSAQLLQGSLLSRDRRLSSFRTRDFLILPGEAGLCRCGAALALLFVRQCSAIEGHWKSGQLQSGELDAKSMRARSSRLTSASGVAGRTSACWDCPWPMVTARPSKECDRNLISEYGSEEGMRKARKPG